MHVMLWCKAKVLFFITCCDILCKLCVLFCRITTWYSAWTSAILNEHHVLSLWIRLLLRDVFYNISHGRCMEIWPASDESGILYLSPTLSHFSLCQAPLRIGIPCILAKFSHRCSGAGHYFHKVSKLHEIQIEFYIAKEVLRQFQQSLVIRQCFHTLCTLFEARSFWRISMVTKSINRLTQSIAF